MRMSTRGRYGARAMLDIAANYEKGPVSLKDMARRQDISLKYLEQLIPPLKAAGLIRSIRGAGGGYTLVKEPHEINLLQIIQALERLSPVDCLDTPGVCPRVKKCATYEVWKELLEATNNILQSITLADMVERQRKLEEGIKDN
ncbi:MAG: Rrf2 family transcriptional regulator [Actinomycetota bacterium]|nr:Rrf2 family transcriptional regulator [Actinomycetota bacterium]